MGSIQCVVKSIEPLTDYVYRVLLEAPQPAEFKAGQYLQLVLSDSDKRPFSIANAPGAAELELHIGASGEDSFAMGAIEHLKSNTQVSIEYGLGEAYFREESMNPIVLIAGGTGFSYINSIAQYLATQQTKRPVFLYWGVKHESALYALQNMQQWADRRANFQFIPVVETPLDDWSGKTGRVHEAVMADIVSLEPYDIYMAGRFEMIGLARDEFIQHGALLENMYADAFAYI
ncbi:NAD(P)H-flavin reductase [Algicola sagamiensis]|uniref:NAD(P)H-flavin reductase n=1 Tax=Algicola sagamiensis TaxID=163869 RepID=UPI00037C1B66|nr:NAD(P)H-flavin reductase [Algicola sagamiensis]